jgi:sterol desaturase/sphingolipid hydroxylase (fatty acid hydroxylase superfamily)
MKPESLVGLLIPLTLFILMALEAHQSVRVFPKVARWQNIGSAFFVMTLVVGSLAPLLIPVEWLKRYSVLNISGLEHWGFPISLLATTFVGYWFHRGIHRFNLLWRMTHQLHHSARRVDLMGAYFSHPLEIVAKVGLANVVNAFLLGATPLAATLAATITAMTSLFQHANIRTPQWLGYFVQRPESHCLHHEYQVHGRNYSDLPIWDILFATFENPKNFNGKVGLTLDADPSLKDMLLMRSVTN